MSYLPSEPIIEDIEAIDLVAITDAVSSQSYRLQSLLEVAATMPHQYFNGVHRVEALWRTLIANEDLFGHATLSGRAGRVADTDMALPFRSLILGKNSAGFLGASEPSPWMTWCQQDSQQPGTAVLLTMHTLPCRARPASGIVSRSLHHRFFRQC